MTEWEIEFWEDENGEEPFAKFLDDLPELKRVAMIAAIERVLAREGPNVCQSEWGKNLGDGTLEFRVRHSADEINAMFPADSKRRAVEPTGPSIAEEPEAGAGESGEPSDDPGSGRRRKSRGEILLRAFFTVDENRIILMTGGYDKGSDPSDRRQQTEIERNKGRVRRIKDSIAQRKRQLRAALKRDEANKRKQARRKKRR